MGIGGSAAGGSAGGLEESDKGNGRAEGRSGARIRTRAEDGLDEAHKEKEANGGKERKGEPRWILNVGQCRSPAPRRSDSL